MSTHLLLHNIRSTYNVGSIFRTADAAGVTHIWLTGYTPTPIDQYGRVRNDIAKTALGAENAGSWMYLPRPTEAIARVRADGYTVTAVEQSSAAVSLNEYRRPKQVCFVLGNEVRGVSKQLRNACDSCLEIPMHGTKESLNVAVAAGVVLFATE